MFQVPANISESHDQWTFNYILILIISMNRIKCIQFINHLTSSAATVLTYV